MLHITVFHSCSMCAVRSRFHIGIHGARNLFRQRGMCDACTVYTLFIAPTKLLM
jgi:hypothetical protein